jgi:hypothetical protein
VDHRRLQRTLFRMQLDPGFASRVRAGGAEAGVGLGAEELRLLRGVDPIALAADRDGRRRAQFLANVSGELALSVAGGLDPEGFTASAEFHEAVRDDRSLPLAFARYAFRCTRAAPRALRALVALESALTRARRELQARPEARPGEIVLAPWVALEDLPKGTLALAACLRTALDTGGALPAVALDGSGNETLLIRAVPGVRPFRLRDVEVEQVSPALAALLRAALEARTRAALAKRVSTPRAELDPVIADLLAEGILVAA